MKVHPGKYTAIRPKVSWRLDSDLPTRMGLRALKPRSARSIAIGALTMLLGFLQAEVAGARQCTGCELGDRPPRLRPNPSATNKGPEIFRAATWNFWNIPDGVKLYGDVPKPGNLDNDLRAPQLAAALNRSKYDVVSINELFAGAAGQPGSQWDFSFYMSGDLALHSSGNVDKDQAALTYAGANPVGTPKSQYPYWIWSPGFHYDLHTDSGLAIYTRMPPKPRKVPPAIIPEVSANPAFPVGYYCIGKLPMAYFSELQGKAGVLWIQKYGLPAGLELLPTVYHESSDPWSGHHNAFEAANLDPVNGLIDCSAAYAWYDKAAGADLMAVKGILWVRLLNAKTNRPINVFTTHTQADYPENSPPELYPDFRASQLSQLQNFIKQMAPGDEDILVMGDLNIQGESVEYQKWVNQEFTGNSGLDDAYRKQMRPFTVDHDWGYTRNPLMNVNNVADPYPQRLDYILFHNTGTLNYKRPETCIQHARVRRDFNVTSASADGAAPEYSYFKGGDLSDHFAVEMQLATKTPYCAPRTALDLSDGSKIGSAHTMEFVNLGAAQWIRIPANVDIVLTAEPLKPAGGDVSKLKIEVYRTDDLSMPITTYNGVQSFGTGLRDFRRGPVISLPFDAYVRLTPEAYNTIGKTVIRAVRLDGSLPELAVPLSMAGFPLETKYEKPVSNEAVVDNSPYSALWKSEWSKQVKFAGKGLNNSPAQQDMWFQFKTEKANIANQCVTFTLLQDEYPDPWFNTKPEAFKIKVMRRDAGSDVMLQNFSGVYTKSNLDGPLPYQIRFGCADNIGLAAAASSGVYLLGVRRYLSANPLEQGKQIIAASITTNIRGFRHRHLGVLVQSDDYPAGGKSDEVVARMTLDSKVYKMIAWEADETSGVPVDAWYLLDTLPTGASMKKLHFGNHLIMAIGEESCTTCGPHDWYADDIDWFTGSVDFKPPSSPNWYETRDIGAYENWDLNHGKMHRFTVGHSNDIHTRWEFRLNEDGSDGRYIVDNILFIPGATDLEADE